MLETAWRRGWTERPSLAQEPLVAAARRQTGLHDFGSDNGWRERLERLICSLHDEAGLNPLGITIAYGQLVSALAGRLRARRLWQRHPEIAEVPITAPILIVGQMRSGSTRMQRVLACDPRFTYTRFFESWNPVPRWPGSLFDDRIVRGWSALRVAKALNPDFGIIHPCSATQADEEIGLHNLSVFGAAFEAQWRIPSFARFGEAMDSACVYREFRRYLQIIRWLRGGRDDRPWILKLPQFTQDLDTVLSTFPDARLIVLQRDPVQLVGSSASLVHNQMVVQSDQVDPAWIGREWVRKTSLREARVAQARARWDVPSIDIRFDAMDADWQAEIAKVYAMLGVAFTPEVQSRMSRFMANHSPRRLRRHRYDIRDFGLSQEGVRRSFAQRETASDCAGSMGA